MRQTIHATSHSSQHPPTGFTSYVFLSGLVSQVCFPLHFPPPFSPLVSRRLSLSAPMASMSEAGKHTILLMQPTANKASRTFMDYETVAACMDGVCGMFERELKRLNPQLRNITYDISDLYRYIDNLADLSALVYSPQINAYQPCNRQWIKQRAFQHLKRLAS